MSEVENNNKKELLKSTGIIGGTQLLTIALGIVRTKIIAILLGPLGVGIAGMLQAILDIARNATGFGINFSGVKYLAESAELSEENKDKTIITIRRWAAATGLLGTLLISIFAYPLGLYSFESSDYTWSIVIASFSLIFTSISASQIAVLQGLSKIGQMAKTTLFGNLFATIVVVPVYWIYGIKAIPFVILMNAAIVNVVSWYYARNIKIKKYADFTVRNTFKSGLGMAKLGFFIVLSGVTAVITMYFIRIVIMDNSGIDSVGYFQAVWTITNIYMSILLNAMLADFFPKLSAINKDNEKMNLLVNQQLELALLLGTSLVIVMIVFAKPALNILYSSKFDVAIPLLKYQMLGSLTTFITWPLGVIFLAKSKGYFAVLTDGIWCISYFAIVFFGWDYWGFNILGVGFVVSGVIKAIITFIIVNNLSGYKFSAINVKYIVSFTVLSTIIFCMSNFCDSILSIVINVILSLLVLIFCFKEVNTVLDIIDLIKLKFTKQ